MWKKFSDKKSNHCFGFNVRCVWCSWASMREQREFTGNSTKEKNLFNNLIYV